MLLQGCRPNSSIFTGNHVNRTMGDSAKRRTPHRITRQIGRVHFEDLSGHEFERLLLAYAVRAGWRNAEWLGQGGADRGRDVWCPGNGRPSAVFLCANYRVLKFAKVASDLAKVIKRPPGPAELFVVAGGAVSATLRERIKAEAPKLGFPSVEVWSGPEFEEKIRRDAPDVLMRFFGGEASPEGAVEFRDAVLRSAEGVLAGTRLSPATLSAEAERLLVAMASVADGRLLRSESHDGYGLTISEQIFLSDTIERREKARWERVIRELLDHDLIEKDGPSGDIFGVTDSGYDFVEALQRPSDGVGGGFKPVSMPNPAQFFRGITELIPEGPFDEGPVKVEIPDKAFASLRLFPCEKVPALKSALAAKQLASGGHLSPMGVNLGGHSWGRNANGAIAYSGGFNGKLTNFTQLFVSGEICGIDMRVVHKVHQDKESDGGIQHRLDVYEFELSCALALENYIKFVRGSLKQTGSLQVEVGLYGVKGSLLGFGIRSTGKALENEIIWVGTVAPSESFPAEILWPSFEQVWEGYGVTRGSEAQERLLRSLGPG